MRKINILLFLCIFVVFANIGFAQSFVDVTASAGITSGGDLGFSWGDYNNDGWIDFFHSSARRLYINNGDSTFSLVSTSPDPNAGAPTYGSVMADFTGDGNSDLLMTQANALSLVINTGDTLSFKDTTAAIGLNLITIPSGNIGAAAVADFDRDGNLDIAFAGSWSSGVASQVRLAKLNTGTGLYEDVAATMLDTVMEVESWNPMWVDVNNDGYMDLFMPSIRNSYPDRRSGLYINYTGDSLKWSEIIIGGSPTNVSAITSVLGDIDNDGDMDLIAQAFSGDGGALNVLLNNGDGTFTDATSTSGISVNANMRGLSLGDYDNDGDLDVLIGSGNMDLTIYQNQLVGGSLTFTNVTSSTVGTGIQNHRSALFVDFDGDGMLDIFAGWTGSNYKLLQNQLVSTNNWIGFRLSMAMGNNKSAIGARVRVVAGGVSMIRDIQGGVCGGMTGGNIVANFGLGGALQADSVIITWPDGVPQTILNLAANSYYDISRELVASPVLISPANGSTIKALSTTLIWTSVATATGYHCQVSTTDTFGTYVINDATLTDTTRALTGLLNDMTYYWRVRAYNDGLDTSNWSTVDSFATSLDFVNVTTAAGIQTGGDLGFSWGYYNNDSLLDLFHSSARRLYINNGDGTFSLVSTSPDPDAGAPTYGSVMADFTGDGNSDLLMTQGSALSLVVNTGDTLSFKDTTTAVGLNLITIPSGNIAVPAVGDFDRDGNLDIAFAGSWTSGVASQVRLAKLNTGTGLYENVAATMLDTVMEVESWNPMWVDVNNDGYMDLFMPSIRNSFPTRRSGLYINYTGDSLKWSEIIIGGSPTNVSAIASVWGDIDNDGDMDLIAQALSSDGGALNVLLNNGDGTFTDATSTSGISVNAQMRGLSLGDYDNDGDLDVLIGGASMDMTIYQNQLVESASLTFTNVTSSTVGSGQQALRSTLFTDYDNDGKLDIFVSYTGSSTRLFKNRLVSTNNWIGFRLSMIKGNNKSAIGARVRVVADGLSMIRDIQGGACGGMTGGNIVANFGLGGALQGDSIIITWPDGTSSVFSHLAANQYYDLDNFVTGVDEPQVLPKAFALSQNYPNPFNPKTTISYAVPHKCPVRIAVYDLLGREIALLVNEDKQPGRYTVEWKAVNLSSGVYFYRMQAGDFTASKKLVLMK